MIKEVRTLERKKQPYIHCLQHRGVVERYYALYVDNKFTRFLDSEEMDTHTLQDNESLYVAFSRGNFENYKKTARRGRPVKYLKIGDK